MWRTWASPDEPKATLQRTTGVRCVDHCFKTHTHTHTHALPHHHIQKHSRCLMVIYGMKKFSNLDLICPRVCVFYLPSSFTPWPGFSSTFWPKRCGQVCFLSALYFSCSHTFLWQVNDTNSNSLFSKASKGGLWVSRMCLAVFCCHKSAELSHARIPFLFFLRLRGVFPPWSCGAISWLTVHISLVPFQERCKLQ